MNFWGGGTQSKWMMLAKDKPTKHRPDSATRVRELKAEARQEA